LQVETTPPDIADKAKRRQQAVLLEKKIQVIENRFVYNKVERQAARASRQQEFAAHFGDREHLHTNLPAKYAEVAMSKEAKQAKDQKEARERSLLIQQDKATEDLQARHEQSQSLTRKLGFWRRP
jgi:predicted subunit of tRNA(5-methylaminomethyl-2-thiouridylate) methyltransferase